MNSSPLDIRLLGNFSLERNGKSLVAMIGDRARALLVYLLLHRDAPQPRQSVAFHLWPDSLEERARANLRTLLHQLRNSLPGTDELIEVTSQSLWWRPDAAFTLDVATFEAALSEAARAERAGEGDAAIGYLERAIDAYGGELLPSMYEEWIEPLRDDLHRRYARALQRLTDLLEQAERWGEALPYAERLVQYDTLDEDSYIRLMRLLALAGDRAGVRRVYQRCEAILRRELDADPGRATREAYDQWMRYQAVSTPAAIPVPAHVEPLVSASSPEPNATTLSTRPLPLSTTTFVGREDELSTLGQILVNPSYRLITLVGPGGTGKTRLALEAASSYANAFKEGSAWVPLADLLSVDQLVPAIAERLGLVVHGGSEPRVQLCRYLRDKELLIVLDNFEHLLEGVPLLAELLYEAPRVTLIVTSRVRLNLQEEWVWDLSGLSLPAGDSPTAFMASSAATLFLERARQARHQFSPDRAEDRAAITRICQLVEGMPLAIELAASWMRLLSPEEIVAELEKSLDFLASSQWNIPARHRSLRALFEHSWALLSPREQAALSRLSQFRGGFTREAAQHVAGATLPVLAGLVDQSLVRRSGNSRYDLHHVVRQYAEDHLSAEAGALDEIWERQDRYFLRWLREQDTLLKGPRQQSARVAILADLTNIRHAWHWTVVRGQVDLLEEVAATLSYFYDLQCLYREGYDSFRDSMMALEGREPARSEAQLHMGWFAHRMGRTDEAVRLMSESVARLRDFPAIFKQAPHPISSYGLALIANGQLSEAQEALEEAGALARSLADEWSLGIATQGIGWIAFLRRDFSTARHLFHQVLGIWEKTGDYRGVMFCLNQLGAIAVELRELDEAERYLEQNRALYLAGESLLPEVLASWQRSPRSELTRPGASVKLPLPQEATNGTAHSQASTSGPQGMERDRWTGVTLFSLLGEVARLRGNLAEALGFFRDSVSLAEEISHTFSAVRAYWLLGDTYRELGDLESAEAAYLRALASAHELHLTELELFALLGLVEVRHLAGAPRQALEWLYVVRSDVATPATLLPVIEEQRDRIVSRMDSEQVQSSQARAQGRTVNRLVAELLQ